MALRDSSVGSANSPAIGAAPWLCTRWSHESCIVSARSRQCEYPLFQRRLSIKAVWGGREDCFVDGRRIAVDDDTYVIFNEGRIYSSRLHSLTPVSSFSIFFRPHMAQDVMRTLTRTPEQLLADPDGRVDAAIEFSEAVRRHDHHVSPVLNYIRHHVDAGLVDETWYDEQLHFLMQRILSMHRRDLQTMDLIPAARAATRKELFRRVGLGSDFINTHFAEAIGLEEIAAASLLSPYHCLRVFKAVYGGTPTACLSQKRIRVAERLLRNSSMQVDEVAVIVGFQSRSTLFRQMRHFRGLAPSTFRRRQQRADADDGQAQTLGT